MMNPNNYYARTYFPAFYFGLGKEGEVGSGSIQALIAGTSSLHAVLSNIGQAVEVQETGAGNVLWLPTQGRPSVRVVGMTARVSSRSSVTASISAVANMSVMFIGSASVAPDLTGNEKAFKRYRRQKDEDFVIALLMAA